MTSDGVRHRYEDMPLFVSCDQLKAQQLMKFSLGERMVTIRVSEGGDTLHVPVYEDLICRSSKLIKDAVEGDQWESDDYLIDLPEFTSDLFKTYHMWLLTGRLHSRDRFEEATEANYNPDNPDDLNAYGDGLWYEMNRLGDLSHLGHHLLDGDVGALRLRQARLPLSLTHRR
jgi:hypothetical protein